MSNPVSVPSPRTARARRSARARARALHVAIAVAVAALLGAAPAGSPFAFEPVVAYVQEAERVTFRPVHEGRGLTGLSSVGTVASGALSIAEYGVADGVLEVVFRLAGSDPVEIRQLVVIDDAGRSRAAAIGSVTVRSAADASASPLGSRGAIAFGDGVVLGAWLFENERKSPVDVTELDLAPSHVARPFVLARASERVPSFAEFERWVETGRDAILASYGDAATAPARRVEAALRAAFPAEDVRRPDAPELTVPAGGAVALMLTPASLDVDLATTALLLDARIVTRSADGAVHARYLPHVVRYAPPR